MISIFAKEAFLNVNPHEPLRLRKKPIRSGHIMRVSSLIRGSQISEKLEVKLNPLSDYENDVCIYVKPMVRKGDDFKFEGKKNYLDIIDGYNLVNVLWNHPEVNVITCSKVDYQTVSNIVKNKVILIPQHHCNFERQVKETAVKIKTVGVIGTVGAFTYLPKNLKQDLTYRGIELIEFSKFFKRQDIVDFYMNIDIQLVWRPYKKILSNPLKIVNAASFGIPTIALYEDAFEEVSNCYFPVYNLEGLLDNLDMIANNRCLYNEFSKNCLKLSEEYHIDNIAKLYKELDQ